MSTTERARGNAAIAAALSERAGPESAAFLPYYPIGYPDYATSLEVIANLSELGVDGFEIGMPFSDPLADGPVIQQATGQALANGVSVADCIEAVATLRRRGVLQPMLLMGYLNPILAYGPAQFVTDAAEAGADGLIVPDLPPEERGILADPCAATDLGLVAFITPNLGEARIRVVAQGATAFLYVVSVTGVTGARDDLPAALPGFLQGVRDITDKPLVVGFGISRPVHARKVSRFADGYIVGSALVREAEKGIASVRALADSLRRAGRGESID